jgi:UDP-GlcNAc:undecaprenyl-phosphate GlcNAc-1-phosphate transferase
MNYLLIALTAFLIGLLLCLGVRKFFPQWGLMDRPHKYGLKRAPIPYYGGLAIIATFYIGIFLFLPISWELLGVLIGGVLIGVMSFMDDFRGLSPWIRLIVQFLVAVLVFAFGVQIDLIALPLGETLHNFLQSLGGGNFFWVIGALAALATIFWLMLMMNAINWIDGLNGLPSGVSTIACLVIFFLSVKPDFHSIDQQGIAIMALILGMACLAFWLFDFYPAKMLMGDTGSMFLGYFLAVLAIFSGAKLATAFLVLGFPILDAIWTVVRRVLAGNSPFKGDLKHFHHRLLEAGLSVRQALLTIYLASAAFGLMALFLEGVQKLWAFLILLFVMALLGFWSVVAPEQKTKRKSRI